MDRLPMHVVIMIVQFAVMQPEPNVNVLSVCSDFYLAAIPILYHSPRVSSRHDSFFLHVHCYLPPPNLHMEPLPTDWAKLSARELVRLGYTKIAALRYTQHLHTIIPNYEGSMPEGGGAEERATAVGAAQSAQGKELDEAERHLKGLPYGVLDAVMIIQVEEEGAIRPTRNWRRVYPFHYHMALLNTTNPLVWCRNPATICPIIPLAWSVVSCLDAKNPPDPATTHLHAYMSGRLPIVPCQTTYIHLHPSEIQGEGDGSPPESRHPLVWLAEELFESLRTSIRYVSVEEQRKILERTPVIIGGVGWGAKPPQVIDGQVLLGGEGSDSPENLQQVADGIKLVISEMDGRHAEAYYSLALEVRRSEDMPCCPGCGA